MRDALDAALTYLSRRILTRHQLVQRLERKGFSDNEIEGALARLLEWGYLNDQEYARTYSLSKQSSYSKKKISYDLKGRGVEEAIIEEVLEETYTSEQERELCRKLAQALWAEESRRWENSYQHKKSYQRIPKVFLLRQKVGNKLMQKGYPQEIVVQALEELNE